MGRDHKLCVCQTDLHYFIYSRITLCRFGEHVWAPILMHYRLKTRLKSGFVTGKLMNLYILALMPSTILYTVLIAFISPWYYVPLSLFLLNHLKSLPLNNPHHSTPTSLRPDSSTCIHHSRMVLDEWWTVLCWVSVRHNTGWRSIFVSSDHIFRVMVSGL